MLKNSYLGQDTNGLSSTTALSPLPSLSPTASLLSSSSSASILSSPSSSSSSSSSLVELTEMIREFWSSFPCPPPWRPRLLEEVNATSRLEPSVGRQVRSFLAGKCQLQGVFDLADLPSEFGLDLRGSGDGGAGGGFFGEVPGIGDGRSVLDPNHAPSSSPSWCDSGCKVALGCAVILAMLMALVLVLVYLTKNRRASKMAAARPSRQQLQMSTSVSDAFNCAEFSNLEVQTDDESNNPFRFRGLPQPPASLCLPPGFQTNAPKWPHVSATCSTFQPLIRLGPAGEYYSYAYSAVYETIDDDDDIDDDENNKPATGLENRPMMRRASREVAGGTRELTSSFQPMGKLPCGCFPFQHLSMNHDRSNGDRYQQHHQQCFLPSETSAPGKDAVQVMQSVSAGCQFTGHCSCHHPDVVISNMQVEAETEFNGGTAGGDNKTPGLCSHNSGDPKTQSGSRMHDDMPISEGQKRSSVTEKQDREKSSDYCSDVSCMSSGSASSSKSGAIGSPSSLSGYTNDLSYTSGCRCDESVAGSSCRLGVAGSMNLEPSRREQGNRQECCTNNEDDNVRQTMLMISSPSAFHPPRYNPLDLSQVDTGFNREVSKTNVQTLRDQTPGGDGRGQSTLLSLHPQNVQHENMISSSKNISANHSLQQLYKQQQQQQQ
ncbi:hypothetical protein EGW08_002295, partial [Elysia chlorotica]